MLPEAKPFYCREWVFDKVAHILDNRTAEKIQVANISGILLVGEPGAGKTALCAELVRNGQRSLSDRVLASHFINAYQPETRSLAGFIRGLVERLRESNLIEGYADKLRHAELAEWLDPARIETDPDESFQRTILFPLLEIDTPPRNLLLVVDSLDEPVPPPLPGTAPPDSDSSQTIGTSKRLYPRLSFWLFLSFSFLNSSRAVGESSSSASALAAPLPVTPPE